MLSKHIFTAVLGVFLNASLFANPTSNTVEEVWRSALIENDEIDSLAVWDGATSPILYVTGKESNKVFPIDAFDGTTLTAIEANLKRPNGIEVIGNRLFIVERDNHQLKAIALPENKAALTFDTDILIKPYGLAVARVAEDRH